MKGPTLHVRVYFNITVCTDDYGEGRGFPLIKVIRLVFVPCVVGQVKKRQVGLQGTSLSARRYVVGSNPGRQLSRQSDHGSDKSPRQRNGKCWDGPV